MKASGLGAMIKLSAFMRLTAEPWSMVAAADLLPTPERPAAPLKNARLRGALALALIPGVAGCAVGPDFVTPPPPVAAKYLEWRDGSIGTGKEDYRDWWRAFHDPVLNRLIELAYNQNLTLLRAGTQVLEARAQLGIQVGEFYPQQQQGVGFTNYNRPSHADAAAAPQVNLSNYWQSALGATATWQLDFWGKFRRGVESADAAYLASIATYDDVLVTLLGDVASTYIGIRTLEKEIAIARENIVRQKEALQIARPVQWRRGHRG
jgi:outer membrane protein TolC